MTVYDATIAKIRQMPEPLVQEVHDYVEFLLTRRDTLRWQLWTEFAEGLELGEADLSDYRANLEEYEEKLARGEIKW